MAVTAQTNQGGWSDTVVGSTIVTSAALGTLRAQLYQNIHYVNGTGSPDADVTAPIGTSYVDDATGIEYVNTDAATAWEAIQTAPALASIPASTGIIMQVGAKQYISAFAASTTVGKISQLTHTETVGREVTAATSADSAIEVGAGVAAATNASAAIGWFQTGGLAEAFVDGVTTDVAVGDFLKLVGLDLLFDSTVKTDQSVAVAVDANTGAAALNTVMMINESAKVTSPLDIAPTVAGAELQVAGKQYFAAHIGSAPTVGKVHVFDYTETTAQEVTAITPATETTARRSGIAVVTGTGLQWFQVGGLAEAFVEGTTDVAAGDFLEVLNTEQDWKKDATAIDVTSGAVAIDAQAADSAVLSTVFLINKIHTVAAS